MVGVSEIQVPILFSPEAAGTYWETLCKFELEIILVLQRKSAIPKH